MSLRQRKGGCRGLGVCTGAIWLLVSLDFGFLVTVLSGGELNVVCVTMLMGVRCFHGGGLLRPT